MKVFKKYNSGKGRTTPLFSLEGHSLGYLASHDATAIKSAGTLDCPALVVNSAIFSTNTINRTFQMVRYGWELFCVSWDGAKNDESITISVTTHSVHNNLLAQYSKDTRWRRTA